jgi:N-acyl homoserine lactone hydrolase
MKNLIFALIALFGGINTYAQTNVSVPAIKLYVMDCGSIDVSDFKSFSDTDDYKNKSVHLANPCFIVSHPKGILLWDTGLPDSLVNHPKTITPYTISKSMSLKDQLKKIGINPNDIMYVSISHSHFDHASGLDNFPKSYWILQKAEVDYAKTGPSPFVVDPTKLKNWQQAKKIMIDNDYDVFGDGTVEMLKTPGHTPGHQSLKIILPSGVIILSGDEFHQRTSFEPLRIPVFNTSRAETIASADRIKTLLKNTKGRLIIQHDAADINLLQKSQ